MDSRESKRRIIAGLEVDAATARKKEEHILARLHDNRQSLQSIEKRIAQMTNSLAAFFTLPNELLLEILKLNQTDESTEWEDAYSDHNGILALSSKLPTLVTISQVSQRLRTLTIGAPTLWTTINTILSRSHTRTKILRVYLQRSNGFPLDITLWGPSGRLTLDIDVLREILPHAAHWRSFQLVSSTLSSFRSTIMMIAWLSAPRLQSLRFVWEDRNRHGLGRLPSHILQGGAPLLTSVDFTGIGIQVCSPPLKSLTSLSLSMPFIPKYPLNGKRILETLCTSLSLEELTISSGVVDPSTIDELLPITLMAIRSITLNFNEDVPFQPLFDLFAALSVPGLKYLCIMYPTLEETRSSNDFTLAFTRSLTRHDSARKYPSLQHLKIMDFRNLSPCSVDQDFINAIPMITSLTIEGSQGQHMIELLLQEQPEPELCLWRQLSTLTIIENFGLDIDVVCDFIAFRKSVSIGYPLESLRLHYPRRHSSVDQIDWLRKNVKLDYM